MLQTDLFRDAILNHSNSEESNSIAGNAHVFENETGLGFVCIQCVGVRLAAELLHQQGPPPAAIVTDWRHQLATFCPQKTGSDFATDTTIVSYCASETLVTEEGLLIPLSQALAVVRAASEFDPTEMAFQSHHRPIIAQWPWQETKLSKSNALSQPIANPDESSFSELLPIQNLQTTVRQANRKKKPDVRTKVAAIATATVAIGGIASWFLFQVTTSEPSDSIRAESTASKSDHPASGTDNSATTKQKNAPQSSPALALRTTGASSGTEPESQPSVPEPADAVVANLTTLETPVGMQDSSESNSESESLETLLSSLNPKEPNSKFSLASVSPTSIISNALNDKQNGSVSSATTSDNAGSTVNPLSEANVGGQDRDAPALRDQDTADNAMGSGTDDEAEATDDAGTELPSVSTTTPEISSPNEVTKSFVLNSAHRKELIAFEQRLSPKLSRCEVLLKLSDGLVIEPAEPVTIEGVGTTRWKIAIEDEEPELLLELQSKPGGRWLCTFQVAMRETSVATLVPLGPRDAQYVGLRLLEYHQWLNNSITTLQDAKARIGKRSRFDFVGEIKKMERQQREVEQAIERWKIIARLSHLLYDDNEIQITMHGVGIDTPKPTPPPPT
jgi:hypothetical protein